jgi:hypothetical protein
MTVLAKSPNEIGARLRASRERAGFSTQDQLCDAIARRGKPLGLKRPSAAVLSRIETGVQPVPINLLRVLPAIIDMPAAEMRPDLAELFNVNVSVKRRAKRRARTAA